MLETVTIILMCLPPSHFHQLVCKMLINVWFFWNFLCFILFLLLILLTPGFCGTWQMYSCGPWNQAWVRPGAEQEGDPYLVSVAARMAPLLTWCLWCVHRPSKKQTSENLQVSVSTYRGHMRPKHHQYFKKMSLTILEPITPEWHCQWLEKHSTGPETMT